MAFVRESFQAYAQEYIGSTIHSNLFPKIPLVYALTGLGGNQTKSTNRIGRPGVQDVFAGKKLSKAQRETLTAGFNAYEPRIHFRTTSNNKNMGARDTMPTVANPTTTSQDQNVGTAKFCWTRKVEPILVWNEALARAMGGVGIGLGSRQKAVASLLEQAADEALNVHLDNWATSFWTGTPTNQASDPWDDAAGIQQAIGSATNTYGNVDRGVGANSAWVPQVVTAARSAVLSSLIDEANITEECGIVGNGIDLVLTGKSIFRTFKDECRNKGGQVFANGMPEMAEYGVGQPEVLKFDRTHVMLDKNCPDNAVACLNLSGWKLITHGDMNFKTTKFVDLKEFTEGAKDAHQAFIETKLILACEEPAVQCYFSNVS
jgi:hypothetical protein